jgi:hypothetical protein
LEEGGAKCKEPDEHDTNKKGEALLWVFFADAGWEASKVEDYGCRFSFTSRVVE